jgi:hypothetical protein
LREKFDQRCFEDGELHLQLKVFEIKLTQAFMTAEDECVRRADLEKAHSDLESELGKVGTGLFLLLLLLLLYIKLPNLI